MYVLNGGSFAFSSFPIPWLCVWCLKRSGFALGIAFQQFCLDIWILALPLAFAWCAFDRISIAYLWIGFHSRLSPLAFASTTAFSIFSSAFHIHAQFIVSACAICFGCFWLKIICRSANCFSLWMLSAIIAPNNRSLPLIGAFKLFEPQKFTCTLVSPLVTISYHKENGKSIWNTI